MSPQLLELGALDTLHITYDREEKREKLVFFFLVKEREKLVGFFFLMNKRNSFLMNMNKRNSLVECLHLV